MELDLLAAAETESDSESNHSNQDNASGRRSVVTAATAGSEAGWSSAVFQSFPFRFNLRFSFKTFSSISKNFSFLVKMRSPSLLPRTEIFPNAYSIEIAFLSCCTVVYSLPWNCRLMRSSQKSFMLNSQHFGLWGFYVWKANDTAVEKWFLAEYPMYFICRQ